MVYLQKMLIVNLRSEFYINIMSCFGLHSFYMKFVIFATLLQKFGINKSLNDLAIFFQNTQNKQFN